jgi:hypothetical protein
VYFSIYKGNFFFINFYYSLFNHFIFFFHQFNCYYFKISVIKMSFALKIIINGGLVIIGIGFEVKIEAINFIIITNLRD